MKSGMHSYNVILRLDLDFQQEHGIMLNSFCFCFCFSAFFSGPLIVDATAQFVDTTFAQSTDDAATAVDDIQSEDLQSALWTILQSHENAVPSDHVAGNNNQLSMLCSTRSIRLLNFHRQSYLQVQRCHHLLQTELIPQW